MTSIFPITDNYAVIDTETTGVGKKDQVIEVTLLHADGSILFNSLVKPTCAVHWSAYNVHKITNEELANQPSWPDVHQEFLEAVNKVDLVYIYNKPFDTRLLDQTYQEFGLVMPDIKTECAMKIVRNWLKSQGRIEGGKVNLTHVCNVLGIQHDDVSRHRALGDCILTDRVIKEITRLNNEINNSVAQSSEKPQIKKPKPIVELSPRLATLEQLKDMVDNSTREGMSFKEWVSELKSNGVSLEPLYFNPKNPDFTACSYSMANMIVPASKLGRNYTPRNIVARGVAFNPLIDAELLEQLHANSQIRIQKTFLQGLIGSADIDARKLMASNLLMKSIYTISKRAKKDCVPINAQYASLPELGNPYTQLKFDLEEPKGILLRKLIINKNVFIAPSYKDRYDTAPEAVTVTINGVDNTFTGQGCMKQAVQSLPGGVANAAIAFFTGKTDSEMLSVKQFFIDSFTGEEYASMQRFSTNNFIDKCLIVPSLVTENKASSFSPSLSM